MGCSPPGSSIHGIFQARILEWVAIFFSMGGGQDRAESFNLLNHDRGRNPKELSPHPLARTSQMHLTYQQTQSCVASAKRTHQMHHRRKENKTIFCAEKRTDQVHREMLRRESSERTLRNILYTKVSKSKKRKCNQDQSNDHHESEN